MKYPWNRDRKRPLLSKSQPLSKHRAQTDHEQTPPECLPRGAWPPLTAGGGGPPQESHRSAGEVTFHVPCEYVLSYCDSFNV